MGLAMYGYLYCNNQIQKAILARDWLEYLEGEEDKQVRVKWDSVEKEGYWEFTNIDSTSGSLANCRATFPTLESIQARLDYAKEKGIGVALWETGQGAWVRRRVRFEAGMRLEADRLDTSFYRLGSLLQLALIALILMLTSSWENRKRNFKRFVHQRKLRTASSSVQRNLTRRSSGDSEAATRPQYSLSR